jgi:phosphatidylglycerol:prolipoprotein diacylglycerol transferase
VFYEWGYYTQHPSQVFSYWRGGMATHGILLGGVVGAWLFSRLCGRSFLEIAEEMAIPGAFIMGVGRIGNFIDGNIVGSITDVWWAVKFPAAEGFRHPVTLYDSLKNFLMIPLLLSVRRRSPPGRGMLLAYFVFWYGFGRLFVDYFREYPVDVFGIGTGQYFNLLMAVVGLGLMICFAKKRRSSEIVEARADQREDSPYSESDSGKAEFRRTDSSLWLRRLALTALLLFPLIIPTDWTKGNVIPPKEPTQAHVSHGANMKFAQEKKMSPTPRRKRIPGTPY